MERDKKGASCAHKTKINKMHTFISKTYGVEYMRSITRQSKNKIPRENQSVKLMSRIKPDIGPAVGR